MHGYEHGLNELVLHLFVKAAVKQVAPAVAVLDLYPYGSRGLFRVRVRGEGVKIHAGEFFNGLCHGHSVKRRGKIQLGALIAYLHSPDVIAGRAGNYLLRALHHHVHVGVGLVEFHGGKLGIVLGIHTLVAENTAYLIHSFKSAHYQPLKVQLRCDAHIHIDVQSVMMGDKGPGVGSAGDRIEHRGLHLEVTESVKNAAHALDKPRAYLKGALHLGVDYQVKISAAIARLLVLQAVEFFRQRPQGF